MGRDSFGGRAVAAAESIGRAITTTGSNRWLMLERLDTPVGSVGNGRRNPDKNARKIAAPRALTGDLPIWLPGPDNRCDQAHMGPLPSGVNTRPQPLYRCATA